MANFSIRTVQFFPGKSIPDSKTLPTVSQAAIGACRENWRAAGQCLEAWLQYGFRVDYGRLICTCMEMPGMYELYVYVHVEWLRGI